MSEDKGSVVDAAGGKDVFVSFQQQQVEVREMYRDKSYKVLYVCQDRMHRRSLVSAIGHFFLCI